MNLWPLCFQMTICWTRTSPMTIATSTTLAMTLAQQRGLNAVDLQSADSSLTAPNRLHSAMEILSISISNFNFKFLILLR